MTDKLDLHGIVRVALKDGDKLISEETHNFVDVAALRMVLAQSLSLNLCPNTGTPYGFIWVFDNQCWTPYTNASGWIEFNKIPDSITLVLLNLPDETSLDANSKLLPVLTATGEIDYSKVVGYSVGRLVSTNQYEGVLDTTVPKLMVKLGNVAKSYVFDAGIATGQFNWVAIMPGWGTKPWTGIQAFKCLSGYNIRQPDDANKYGWVRPGVTDGVNTLTAEDEILLFFTHNGASRWKYNLTTGAMTQVPPTDFAYNWTCPQIIGQQYCGNQVVVNNYLYVISKQVLYKINITTGGVEAQITIGYSSDELYGLWYDGEYLWTSCYDASSSTRAYVMSINPGTLSQVSKTVNTSYTGWGGLPASWNKTQTCINKIGSIWFVYNMADDCVLACTDLKNVCGSLVGILPGMAFCGFESGGQEYHFYQGTPTNFQIGDETTDGHTTFNAAGYWLSDDSYSNFWSATKLSEVKVKSETTKAFIDYGYEFGLGQTSVT